MKLLTSLILSLAATTAFAHHGSNGQFNHDIKVEVSGVITDIRLVNPHSYVYFDATGATGETQEWRCEMRGASGARNAGWTEDLFVKGSPVSITGTQARREEFGCYMETITFEDGLTLERNEEIGSLAAQPVSEAELAPGTPLMHGLWNATPDRGHTPGPTQAAVLASAWPADVPVPNGRMPFVSSEMGIAASAVYTQDMHPRFNCQATNIFHDWWFSQTVHQIDQSDDKIVITYGFMDIVRTIHMDMDEHPNNIVPSRAGHSIGRWEGDSLIVDTIGFAEGWISAGRQGIKHSDQMHTVEKFDLSDDNEWLIMTYTVEDPLYLEQPYIAQLSQRRSDNPFAPYDCVELTEERVEGF